MTQEELHLGGEDAVGETRKRKDRKRTRKRKRKAEAEQDAQDEQSAHQLEEEANGGTDVKDSGDAVAQQADVTRTSSQQQQQRVDHETTAIEWRGVPRVSIALPSSIVNCLAKHELQTLLCGQIARSAAMFCVDEIILFEEYDEDLHSVDYTRTNTAATEASNFMRLVLKYVETPPYLRKYLFPVSDDLKFVGLLPPLEAPHHLKIHELLRFREGLVVPQGFKYGDALPESDTPDTPSQKSKANSKFVEIGLKHPMRMRRPLPIGSRVTLDFGEADLYTMPPSRFNNANILIIRETTSRSVTRL